jgi:hypothetical protein
MKAQVKVGPGLIIEVEAGKQKDLYKLIASAHEVFGEKCCGLCGSENIVPVWRTVSVARGKKMETFEFPEWHCNGVLENKERCGARLSLGTINDDSGTLFPQRRLVFEPKDVKRTHGRPATKEEKEKGINGEYGRHRGWTRFKGKDE